MTKYEIVRAGNSFALKRTRTCFLSTEIRFFCTFNQAGGNYWVSCTHQHFCSDYVWRLSQETQKFLQMFEHSQKKKGAE